MDPIYNKIADRSIMIEMGTLSVWDINSLWHLKNAIFFDWLMFFSIFISLPRFHKAHQAEGWSIFETKCRSVDFGGIPSEQVLNGVKRLIKQSGLKVLIQVRAAKMLINTFKPSLLVEADYSSTPRALNFAARLKDIPIVELQHGIIHKSHPGYAYFVPANYQEQRPLPNKILVWGEAFKQIILEAGNAFDPGDIVVTGYPRLTEYLDAIARSEKQDVQQKVRTILDVNEGSILITITSSSEVGSYLCDLLAEILKKLTGNRFVFCVKLHPRELDSWKSSYKTIATDPHIRFLSDNDVDLYDLLVASDIHATVSSTVFLECFALGIPNFFIYHPVYSSSGMGLVDPAEFTVVKTPDSFIDEFKRLTEDSTYREKTITTGRTIGRRFFATEVCAEDAIINELNRFA